MQILRAVCSFRCDGLSALRGAGLKDSKEAVEQLAARQGLHHLKLASPGIGCVGMLVSLFVFVLIVVAVLGLLAVFGFGA